MDAARERAPLAWVRTRLPLLTRPLFRLRHSFPFATLIALLLFATSFASTDAGRPPPHLTVLFLGDSVTVGAGASASDSRYASIVMQRLRSSGFDAHDETIVSAFGGIYTDLVKATQLRADSNESGTLIIVEVGAHSVIENRAMPLATYQHAYGLMLDCLEATGAALIVGTVPSLNWTSSDALYARADAISSIIAHEAGSRGIPVADIWSATRDRPDLVSDDHMHPNDGGHRVIADLYWQHIVSMLPPTPRTPSTCPYAVSDLARVVS